MSGAGDGARVRLGELLAALSLATDLGTDQPLEHALRTALLAVRLGEAAGVDPEELRDAWLLGVLHAIGCTADAPEAAAVYGDDRRARSAWSTVDGGRPGEVVRFLWERTGEGRAPGAHARAFAAAVAAGPRAPRRAFTAHCEVADRLAGRLGLGDAVRDGLWHVFERWDGRGFPRGIAGEALPRCARLLHVARDAAAVDRRLGADAAAAIARDRSGGAYEPALAAVAGRELPGLLAGLAREDVWDAALRDGPVALVEGDALNAACAVAGDFADLKSACTPGHAAAVAELAEAAGWRLGLDAAAVAALRRAGHLQDVGRVAVSTAIWDRPAPLRRGEWERVRLHPYFTERAFARVTGLEPAVAIAAAHHERLDGSGYHRGAAARDLGPAARALAAAGAFQAMTEPRRHRPALGPDAAAAELAAAARAGRLDPVAVDAVLHAAGRRDAAPAATAPGGLTPREVQVLRRLARGATNRAIAAELGVSPKTVGHHVEHVYAKLGVSSRAAAALVAAESGLLGG
jgi:HD-GYP domain-containing protein (c-di-GMP phosphodiesterase class II)